MIHFRFPSEKNYRMLYMPLANSDYPQWEVRQQLMIKLKLNDKREAIVFVGLAPNAPVRAHGQYVIQRVPPNPVPLAPIQVECPLPTMGVPSDTGPRHTRA